MVLAKISLKQGGDGTTIRHFHPNPNSKASSASTATHWQRTTTRFLLNFMLGAGPEVFIYGATRMPQFFSSKRTVFKWAQSIGLCIDLSVMGTIRQL